MIKHLFRAVAAVIVILATAPAWADDAPCAERDVVVDRLQTHYEEVHAGSGLQTRSDTQALVEVWASRETGTFTVMLTSPNGVSCVLATGTNWQFSAVEPEASDQAS